MKSIECKLQFVKSWSCLIAYMFLSEYPCRCFGNPMPTLKHQIIYHTLCSIIILTCSWSQFVVQL